MKLDTISNYKYLIVRNWLASDRSVNPNRIDNNEVAKCIKSNKILSNGEIVTIHTNHGNSVIDGKSTPYTEVYLEHNGQEYYNEVFN